MMPIGVFHDPIRAEGPTVFSRLEQPCPPSPPHTAPSTSWKHELPKFRGCQWSSTAGGGAQLRAIDSPETSEKRGFHRTNAPHSPGEVDGASCQARAGMT